MSGQSRPHPAAGSVPPITLQREMPTAPVARLMMERLTRELAERYGDGGGGHYRPEDAERESAVFVIARLNDEPVGCGAIRPLDPANRIGEVKRMYVEPHARGRSVGGALLAGLEELAGQLGYHVLRLETGILQPEAMRVYERAGYVQIPCYGYHADDPRSRCFEKWLGSEGGPPDSGGFPLSGSNQSQ